MHTCNKWIFNSSWDQPMMMNQNHQIAALQRSLSEQNMPKVAGYLNGRFHETLSENNILKDFKCQKLAKNLFPSQVRKIMIILIRLKNHSKNRVFWKKIFLYFGPHWDLIYFQAFEREKQDFRERFSNQKSIQNLDREIKALQNAQNYRTPHCMPSSGARISPQNSFIKTEMQCPKMDINGNYQSWTPRSANANFRHRGNFQNFEKFDQTMIKGEPPSGLSFEPRSVSHPLENFNAHAVGIWNC